VSLLGNSGDCSVAPASRVSRWLPASVTSCGRRKISSLRLIRWHRLQAAGALREESRVKPSSTELMAGWVIAIAVIGSIVAAFAGAFFMEAEPKQSIEFWMSLWWAWAPVGILIGFLIARDSK